MAVVSGFPECLPQGRISRSKVESTTAPPVRSGPWAGAGQGGKEICSCRVMCQLPGLHMEELLADGQLRFKRSQRRAWARSHWRRLRYRNFPIRFREQPRSGFRPGRRPPTRGLHIERKQPGFFNWGFRSLSTSSIPGNQSSTGLRGSTHGFWTPGLWWCSKMETRPSPVGQGVDQRTLFMLQQNEQKIMDRVDVF